MKETRIVEILAGARPKSLAEAMGAARSGIRKARMMRDRRDWPNMVRMVRRVQQLLETARRITESNSMLEEIEGAERVVDRLLLAYEEDPDSPDAID